MALNSLPFLLFLAAVTAVYYVVPKKFQWVVLLVASYGFYLSAGYKSLFYILGTTLFTYAAGLVMQKIRDDFQTKLSSLGADVTKEEKQQMKKSVTKKISVRTNR